MNTNEKSFLTVEKQKRWDKLSFSNIDITNFISLLRLWVDFNDLPEGIKNTPVIASYAIKINPRNYFNIKWETKNNIIIIKKTLETDWALLKEVLDYSDDKELIYKLSSFWEMLFNHISEEVLLDAWEMLKFIKYDASAIKLCSRVLLDDIDFLAKAYFTNYDTFSYFWDKDLIDKKLLVSILRNYNPYTFIYQYNKYKTIKTRIECRDFFNSLDTYIKKSDKLILDEISLVYKKAEVL